MAETRLRVESETGAASPLEVDRAVETAARALRDLRQGRRTLGVRAGGRCDDSGRIRAVCPLSGRGGRCGARTQDRRLSSPRADGGRRLAAVPRRRVQHQRQRQGLFRAEDDRRRYRRPPHAHRSPGDPRPWRRRDSQCLHPHPAGALRHRALGERAADAGRDHAPAALVSLPSVEDLVLGAHGDRAAAGAAGAEAQGAQPARRLDPRAVREPPERAGLHQARGAPEPRLVLFLRRASTGC